MKNNGSEPGDKIRRKKTLNDWQILMHTFDLSCGEFEKKTMVRKSNMFLGSRVWTESPKQTT